MKKRALILIFLFPHMAGASEVKRRVTLEDAKNYAIGHNFSVQALKEEVNATSGEKKQARAKFFPKLGIAGGADTELSSSAQETAPLGYIYGTYTVFNGFKDQREYTVADLKKQVAESDFRKAQFELGLEVEKLFYLYLIKNKVLEIHKASLVVNEQHKEMVRRRRASGLVSDSDVMEFELRDSYLKSSMSSLQQELDEARLNLVRMMGPDLGAEIEPFGDIPHLHINDEFQNYITRAEKANESIRKASSLLASSELQLKSARSDWIPTLDIEARAGWLDLEKRPADKGAAIAGMVVAKWDFFSGFETTGKIETSRARALKSDFELKQTILSAMTGIEISFLKLRSIQERVHVESENEKRAQKYYNAVVSEYKRGIKNGPDVKGAEEALLNARVRREEYKYNFIVTKLEMEKTTGTIVATAEHETPPDDPKKQKKTK